MSIQNMPFNKDIGRLSRLEIVRGGNTLSADRTANGLQIVGEVPQLACFLSRFVDCGFRNWNRTTEEGESWRDGKRAGASRSNSLGKSCA